MREYPAANNIEWKHRFRSIMLSAAPHDDEPPWADGPQDEGAARPNKEE